MITLAEASNDGTAPGLVYVLVWTGERCPPVGGVGQPTSTNAASYICTTVALVDATTGEGIQTSTDGSPTPTALTSH